MSFRLDAQDYDPSQLSAAFAAMTTPNDPTHIRIHQGGRLGWVSHTIDTATGACLIHLVVGDDPPDASMSVYTPDEVMSEVAGCISPEARPRRIAVDSQNVLDGTSWTTTIGLPFEVRTDTGKQITVRGIDFSEASASGRSRFNVTLEDDDSLRIRIRFVTEMEVSAHLLVFIMDQIGERISECMSTRSRTGRTTQEAIDDVDTKSTAELPVPEAIRERWRQSAAADLLTR